jgi:hypothetical protein
VDTLGEGIIIRDKDSTCDSCVASHLEYLNF